MEAFETLNEQVSETMDHTTIKNMEETSNETSRLPNNNYYMIGKNQLPEIH